VIALTPPARDALLSLPEREGAVFLSQGRREAVRAAAVLLLARGPGVGTAALRLLPLHAARLRALHEGEAEPAEPM
jgi:hypothetical protein